MTTSRTTPPDVHAAHGDGQSGDGTRKGRAGRRLTALLLAPAAALAVWAVADPLLGVDLRVVTGGATTRVGPAAVLATAFAAALLGLGLLAALERLTAQARTIWTITAAAVLVVSLAGPLGGVTTGAKVTLACMHLVVAAALFGVVAATARRRDAPQDS
ncbi:DUF6069 family protein [Microbispora sp. NPDC049125]|uniref:DUF6069 family protein n=1 Tax=Microbispora sp. NPDC049125 TaxID=3154929 RepID=UPI003465F7F7